MNVDINFGKEAADSQTAKLKELLGSEYADLPLVLIFDTAKAQELEEALKGNIAKSDKENNLTTLYKITQSGFQMMLQSDSGNAPNSITGTLSSINGLLKELADTGKSSINLNLSSGISFQDWFGYHEQGIPSLVIFLKSLA